MARTKEPGNPHDALFRQTFARAEHAAAELRAVLPRELLSRLDLSTLRLEPGSFVDAELASSQSDLLFTVDVQGKPALLYLLFEHQSSVDVLMPFRMLKYVIRVLDQHVTDAGGGRKALPLPLVVPVVLHHSATGWTAPTRLEDLFDPELVARPAILQHLPRLSFVMDDISRLTDDELTRRAMGMLPTLTLWALRDARRAGQVEQSLSRWLSVMQALVRTESGLEALTTVLHYISQVAQDLPRQTLVAVLALAAPQAKETLMTTLAEQWKAEGARRVLLQLLQAKFGEPQAADRERLEAASEEQVLRWTSRILDADSLAAVLAD